MKKLRCGLAAALALVLLISGCGAAPAQSRAESSAPLSTVPYETHSTPRVSSSSRPAVSTPASSAADPGPRYEVPPFRDAVFHEGVAVAGNGVEIDLSAVAEGYVAVRATSEKKLKCQIVFGDTKYNYDLSGSGTATIYPLQSGSGSYRVRVMQNTTEDRYTELFAADAWVTLNSEFEPFLRPNQRSAYSEKSACVAKAAAFAAESSDAADLVSRVYAYIARNVDYDYDKARQISSGALTGYLPSPEATYSSGKGICYDYASLAAAMLRSQGIPTKLIIGYVSSGEQELCHAWNMIWLEESGWITVEIEAPAHAWQRIDLTFAAAGQGGFSGDGTGYADKEVY